MPKSKEERNFEDCKKFLMKLGIRRFGLSRYIDEDDFPSDMRIDGDLINEEHLTARQTVYYRSMDIPATGLYTDPNQRPFVSLSISDKVINNKENDDPGLFQHFFHPYFFPFFLYTGCPIEIIGCTIHI